MFELITRLALGLAIFGFSIVAGSPSAPVAGAVSLIIAAVGAAGLLLERRGLRNAGFAGLLAGADAMAIATLVGSIGRLDSLGFLVLLPCALSALRHRSQAVLTAPIATAALFASFALFASQPLPGVGLLLQAAGVLAVGLVLPSQGAVQTILAADSAIIPESAGPLLDPMLDIREKYRSLRDAYQELERKTRKDRASASLLECRGATSGQLFVSIAERLSEVCGAQKCALYVLAQYGSTMVVRSTHGFARPDTAEYVVEINLARAASDIREQADRAAKALRHEPGAFANVVLFHQNRPVGMISLGHQDPEKLEAAQKLTEDLSEILASMLVEAVTKDRIERQLRQSELLYDLASLADGADSRASLSARFASELKEIMGADAVGVYLLDGAEPLCLAQQGPEVLLIDEMSFAHGPGVRGWLEVGAPELLMPDVRLDDRCPAHAAVKSRTGSYFVLPLVSREEPFGMLTASTRAIGGLDLDAVESFRVAGAELSRALARYDDRADVEGLMTPQEFQQFVANHSGCIVTLEPIRHQKVIETVGKSALEYAMRKFVRRVRSRLPIGGAVCRRKTGDCLAFLPGFIEESGTRWANEMAASAALIGLRSPNGATRLPLAFRARVAYLGTQEHQISPMPQTFRARSSNYAETGNG